MKRLLFILITGLLFAGFLSSEASTGNESLDGDARHETIILKGTVVDVDTKEELVCAKVFVEGTEVSACTDINGNFEIAGLNPGENSIKVEYISYKEKILSNVKLKYKKSETINIELETL